jgi:hypothetical protein
MYIFQITMFYSPVASEQTVFHEACIVRGEDQVYDQID